MNKEFSEEEVKMNKSSFSSWVERTGNKRPFDPNAVTTKTGMLNVKK